jgi:4-hydroxy-tetrahydrodipicolinate reductase
VGLAAARAALDDGAADRAAGVVDPDRTARETAAESIGCTAFASISDLPAPAVAGEVALVAFSSAALPSADAALALLRSGRHVVTTCEELAFPDPALRARLDSAARSASRALVVTGANPGFVMDRLPALLARSSRAVRAVRVQRRVDSSRRRGPLVRKTGRGLTAADFAARVAAGTMGHVGLSESTRLIARALGWDGELRDDGIEPVLDASGAVAGLHQWTRLVDEGGRSVELDLQMVWGIPDEGDRVEVDGDPPLRVQVEGGFHGDRGTASQVSAAVALAPRLAPGFWDPVDLPLATPR